MYLRPTLAALPLLASPLLASGPHAGVEALNRRFAEAMVKADATALLDCYTEDGQLIFFKGQTFKGRTEIKGFLAGFFTPNKVKSMTIASREWKALGAGYLLDQGTYEMVSVGADGKEEKGAGRYLQILRKDKDGKWRLFRDCPLMD